MNATSTKNGRKTPLLRMIALAAALASSTAAPAFAQDRVVGREALDPSDRANLPPAIDGRTDAVEDVDPRALEEFREPLAPHGAWVDDPTYGTVWVPHASVVGPDFTPYQTAGHWELTSDGDWLWVSDYAWGDIPFHYGRWVWVDGRGWAWIPGRVWAPAWVVWRTGPYGYVGWGPCPPTWGWYGGAAVWLWWPPYTPYWFVETRYVFARRVHHHVIREPARVSNAARQTTPLRRPANPSRGGGLDGHRPARPDLDQMRYAGPRPTARAAERHPEVGLDRGRRAPGATRRDGADVGLARSRGVGGLDRDRASRAGVDRPDAPAAKRDRPDGPRAAQPGGVERGEPTARPAPDRDARPAPRGPSHDPPAGEVGRGISPPRDVSPSRDAGASRATAPTRAAPSTPPSKRRTTVAPSAPPPKAGGRVGGPRRGRR